MKLGSEGEYEAKDINSNTPNNEISIPKISINLLITKIKTVLANFFISINDESNYHFVSSNFCC